MEDEAATTDNTGFKGLLKQFISAYESFPLLWDKDNKDYTNRIKRRKALLKLAEILSKIKPCATVEDVKKKINSLRSNYRKELQKIMQSREASNGDWDDIYKPQSWVFYELTFLGNVVGPHLPLVRSKSEVEEPSDDFENDTAAGFDYSARMQHQESSSASSTPQPTFSDEHNEPPKKKPKIKLIEKVDAGYACNSDESIHQATVWANKLNVLEPLQRIYAVKAINDILFEAELGNLSRRSLTARDGGDAISDTIIVLKQEGELISRM